MSTARQPTAWRSAPISGARLISCLSGLNIGLNLGNSIWHSGTLAAAKQAALLGLRGIALSAPAGAEPDFEPFKPWIRRVIETLLAERSLPLVNVNLPREPRGLVWTRASVRSLRRADRADQAPAGTRAVLVYRDRWRVLRKARTVGPSNRDGFH